MSIRHSKQNKSLLCRSRRCCNLPPIINFVISFAQATLSRALLIRIDHHSVPGLYSHPHSHSLTAVERRNRGLKTAWLSRLPNPLGGCVQNASILSSSCLSLTHFPNPPDLLDTQDVYLRHGFASLRCCFKFHVCNSKRQREMGNLSPRNHSPTPAKWKMLLAQGCSCRTNCV